jgi:sugar phosphate isomerase/epimerase
MKVYAASVLLYAYSLEETLHIAHELGYNGVEIWHYHLIRSKESPSKIGRLAETLKLSLSLHALSWDLNFTSQLPSIREESIRLLETSIDTAVELGANPVVVHPGRVTVPNEEPAHYWPWLIDGVVRLGQHAARYDVRLSIELMEHIPADGHRLMDAVDMNNVAITFDAAHVPWTAQPLAYLTQLPQVDHVHISDASAEKIHLPLGDGGRDFRSLLRHIDRQLSVAVTIEGMEYDRTIALARQNKLAYDRLLQQMELHQSGS